MLQRNAPKELNDGVLAKIHDYKHSSVDIYVEEQDKRTPLAALLVSTHNHAKTASIHVKRASEAALIQHTLHLEVMEKLASMEGAIARLEDKAGNKKTQKTHHKPLCDCANEYV